MADAQCIVTEAELQSEIISMVARERGLPEAKVRMTSRLLHDLGMDGDDAVEFFIDLEKRFGTDLTHLHARWRDHFGPEGLGCGFGLIVCPVAVISGALSGVAGLDELGAAVVGMVVLAASLWALRRWGPPDRTVPIFVADVVAAVAAGAWPQDVGREQQR